MRKKTRKTKRMSMKYMKTISLSRYYWNLQMRMPRVAKKLRNYKSTCMIRHTSYKIVHNVYLKK